MIITNKGTKDEPQNTTGGKEVGGERERGRSAVQEVKVFLSSDIQDR